MDDFLAVNRKLAEYREVVGHLAESKVSDLGADALRSMEWVNQQLSLLGFVDAYRSIHRAIDLLRVPTNHCSLVCHHIDEAIRSIDDRVRTEWTYHYGENTINISTYEFRWSAVLRAFPSSKFEIESALDLYALRHFTASVFHFIRASELCMRVLATELAVTLPRGKPITHANWQEIIDACEKQVKQVGQTVRAGDAKDTALSFYSGALAHLHHLKDGYRNDVMHTKAIYKSDDAFKVSHATKNFMEHLATRLAEKPRKKGFKDGKIDWGF